MGLHTSADRAPQRKRNCLNYYFNCYDHVFTSFVFHQLTSFPFCFSLMLSLPCTKMSSEMFSCPSMTASAVWISYWCCSQAECIYWPVFIILGIRTMFAAPPLGALWYLVCLLCLTILLQMSFLSTSTI